MIVAHAQQPPFRKLLGHSPPSASCTGRATVLIRPNPAKTVGDSGVVHVGSTRTPIHGDDDRFSAERSY